MKRKKSIVSYFIFAFYIWNNLVDNKPAVVGGVGTKPIGPVISQSPKKTPRPISQIDVRFCLVLILSLSNTKLLRFYKGGFMIYHN